MVVAVARRQQPFDTTKSCKTTKRDRKGQERRLRSLAQAEHWPACADFPCYPTMHPCLQYDSKRRQSPGERKCQHREACVPAPTDLRRRNDRHVHWNPPQCRLFVCVDRPVRNETINVSFTEYNDKDNLQCLSSVDRMTYNRQRRIRVLRHGRSLFVASALLQANENLVDVFYLRSWQKLCVRQGLIKNGAITSKELVPKSVSPMSDQSETII